MKPDEILREDYNKHFMIGLLIVVLCTVFLSLLIMKLWAFPVGALIGWHVARALAWIKEGHDVTRPETNTADIYDAKLTEAGASVGVAVVLFAWAICFARWGVA